MPNRPRHQVKELEEVLKAAEDQGWRVTKGKYYMMWCPCPEEHFKSVHLTPSNPHYKRNLLKKLSRSTCWEENE